MRISRRKEQQGMEASIDSPYMDYAGAERYTTLHRVTLWRAVRDGKLKASGYGRAVRFRREDKSVTTSKPTPTYDLVMTHQVASRRSFLSIVHNT